MAVAVGGLLAGSLALSSRDITEVAMSLRNRMKEEVDLTTGDVQYAYPLNFGDNLEPMRDELTDGALLLRTQKVETSDLSYDPRTPTYFLTDQVGNPVTGYTIDQVNGWILFDPSAGSGAGIWHSRNEANQEYYFGRRFKLNAIPAAATIDVTTSDAFTVWVNNQAVASGSTGANLTGASALDIQPYLKSGENQVVISCRRASATAGDVSVTNAVISDGFGGNVDVGTAAGSWSASRYSVLGLAGRVDFRNHEGGSLYKRSDRIARANGILDTLTALLRAEGQHYDSLLSLVK